MGKRTSYEPGTFSAVDLTTTDSDAAEAFYGSLFGWDATDIPMGDGAVFTSLTIAGDHAAGLFAQPQEGPAAGVPSHWFSYVTVARADDTAARAKELGGVVHIEPHDVGDSGHLAVIADPTGAAFGAWEPRRSIGAERVNDPGCLTMNELSTNDTERASDFYAQLFGWRVEELDTGGAMRYWSIRHDGAARGLNGGMRELAPEQLEAGIPPHWMPYFTVESVTDAIASAEGQGGVAHAGPIDIPAGRMAVLGDPQGAIFGTFEGEVDD